MKAVSSNLPFTIFFEDFAFGDVSSIPYQSEAELMRRRSTVTFVKQEKKAETQVETREVTDGRKV